MAWIAFRDACSPVSLINNAFLDRRHFGERECVPANMISLSFPFPILTKNDFCTPLSSLDVNLKVEENPLPPWEANLVASGSRESDCRIAGSISRLIWVDILGTSRQKRKQLTNVLLFPTSSR